MARYDYIITGAGAAGLSLLMHMMRSGKLSDKKILLLDKAPKKDNDRTWCFWEKEPGPFEEIVYSRWERLAFYGNNEYSAVNDIFPYQYKLIRGIDFYNYCFNVIKAAANIDVRYGNVEACVSNEDETYVLFNGEQITAAYIFNSILFQPPVLRKNEHFLLQHFKGWFIKTPRPVFDAGTATLMDFRPVQDEGATFVYVMPFNANEALIEYTLFSPAMLSDEQYDAGLKDYCENILSPGEYKIVEVEKGSIPMTSHRFKTRDNNIINIGTAGGQTKASSGYTFNFIQKNSAAIVNALVSTGKPFLAPPNRRFNRYDAILLNVLYNKRMPGAELFTTLMKNNDMRDVLKFLDNETSVFEELQIIRCLPALTFLRSAFV